jgi:alpha-amylase/alpha-mannosidase (GH57 family)
MIDGKYNHKVNERLNNIYFRDNDLQNKIYFKNMMNDAIAAYAG